ncbi:MAG: PqqD family protein [Anaerolineales bacterium]|jgi:hypothetical protein|nr:PqqD family protein [Anaerolineales bacterium]
MITLETRIDTAPGVIGRIVDQEAVLVLTNQAQIKVTNQTGAYIWSKVDGRLTVRQIAAILSQEFEVSPAQAEQDTLDFIQDLIDRGVLSAVIEPGG